MNTKFPYAKNGMRYGTGANGARVCTGAMMGRSSFIPGDKLTVRKLHLRRVVLSGDYDQGGAYWGGGSGTLPLYCAWGDSATEQAECYYRAPNRRDARAQALADFPNAKFFN